MSLHCINHICCYSNPNYDESLGAFFGQCYEYAYERTQSEFFNLYTQGSLDHSGLLLPLRDNRFVVQSGLAYECMQGEYFHLNPSRI